MHPLAERYLQHVALHLPDAERAEIERELRSQIEDTLEGRHGPTPTEADVAGVLRELGAPRALATQYSGPQSLVGPALYPYLREVLRLGWMIVPTAVLALNLLRSLGNGSSTNIVSLAIRAGMEALSTGVWFTGIVVLIFVVLEREGVSVNRATKAFDPLALPPISPASHVDKFEAATGIATGVFGIAVLAGFLVAGGLTWAIGFSSSGPVLPAPLWALAGLLLCQVAHVVLNLLAIVRDRWTFGTWLTDAVIEAASVPLTYIGILQPLGGWFNDNFRGQSGAPVWLESGAEIFALVALVTSIASHLPKLIKLWRERENQRQATISVPSPR